METNTELLMDDAAEEMEKRLTVKEWKNSEKKLESIEEKLTCLISMFNQQTSLASLASLADSSMTSSFKRVDSVGSAFSVGASAGSNPSTASSHIASKAGIFRVNCAREDEYYNNNYDRKAKLEDLHNEELFTNILSSKFPIWAKLRYKFTATTEDATGKQKQAALDSADGALFLEVEKSIQNTSYRPEENDRSHRVSWLNVLKQYSIRFFNIDRPYETIGYEDKVAEVAVAFTNYFYGGFTSCRMEVENEESRLHKTMTHVFLISAEAVETELKNIHYTKRDTHRKRLLKYEAMDASNGVFLDDNGGDGGATIVSSASSSSNSSAKRKKTESKIKVTKKTESAGPSSSSSSGVKQNSPAREGLVDLNDQEYRDYLLKRGVSNGKASIIVQQKKLKESKGEKIQYHNCLASDATVFVRGGKGKVTPPSTYLAFQSQSTSRMAPVSSVDVDTEEEDKGMGEEEVEEATAAKAFKAWGLTSSISAVSVVQVATQQVTTQQVTTQDDDDDTSEDDAAVRMEGQVTEKEKKNHGARKNTSQDVDESRDMEGFTSAKEKKARARTAAAAANKGKKVKK